MLALLQPPLARRNPSAWLYKGTMAPRSLPVLSHGSQTLRFTVEADYGHSATDPRGRKD